MMKNGMVDKTLGDTIKMAAKNPGKNASPPSIGVGRVCQRSFFGIATQPQRAARRRTNGTHKIVNRNDIAGAKIRMRLLLTTCMEAT